ncbi:MAG: hypothetical protein M5U19_04995 [Microthrixaceae bacterium]|nr:hypothetical protein [Microthrixaceae bacterium]
MIYSVPTLTWEDLQKYDVPNLKALLEDSVVGDLSVRSVTRHTDAVDGYATLNAGTRTEGTRQGSLAFVAGLNRGSSDHSGDPTDVPSGAYDTEPPDEDLPSQPVPAPVDPDSGAPAGDDPAGTDNAIETGSVESYNGSPAAEEFARRTGVLPPVGSVFNFGIVSMRTLNSRLLFDAEVGALGAALEAAGVRRAVIANGDHRRGSEDTEYRREGSIRADGRRRARAAGPREPEAAASGSAGTLRDPLRQRG